MSSKIRVGIIGASGYTGQELLSILFRHPQVEIVFLSSESNSGKKISEIFPQFNYEHKFISLNEARNFNKAKVDAVFFTTPNNIAVNEVKNFLDKGISVIDFSADFRLTNNDDYEKYYGFKHSDLELLDSAIYGLVEEKREEIKAAKEPVLIANPGCYTTASNLALTPVCKYNKNHVDLNSIIIDAKSGISGAGKKVSQDLTYNEANESLRPYNIAGKHRHTPEINMFLSEISGTKINVSFTPHLIPMFRGLLVTCYINTNEGFDFNNFYNHYSKYFKDEYFVTVLEKGKLPETRWTNKNNHCFIGLDYDPETKRIIIASAIDNLYKGAAGQAVQNMNLVFGLDERLGL